MLLVKAAVLISTEMAAGREFSEIFHILPFFHFCGQTFFKQSWNGTTAW
jgi:hypothetical protein